MNIVLSKNSYVTIYIDKEHEEMSSCDEHSYCGLSLIADIFASDINKVTDCKPTVISETSELWGNIIVAGTVHGNCIINSLIKLGKLDISCLYNGQAPKWDCYMLQYVSGSDLTECGYPNIDKALVIVGSNKRGAMYGMFHISERIGVSPWIYMADAVPVKRNEIHLTPEFLEFSNYRYISKEPSVKYRGIFINDESPSFTGWAYHTFGGVNEECYKHIFELLLRMKANYLWPAMWGNSFSEEGKEFPLANAVLADAYGICMGTSHHEACCRAGVEWQRVYKKYGNSNAWDFAENREAITKFWKEGIERNGKYEGTITLGMRGEADSRLKGDVKYNIDLLKSIITTQTEIIEDYGSANPRSKTNAALKIYIPYSENEEYYYGPDDGSLDGLNVWEGMKDVTIMLTDDNYGNIRSLPEESIRNRAAGWGLYYHLDGHVGTGAYEWVSSTQLEHIWEQLTMAYDYNVDDIWVINVGDIKPLEMELNYCMDLAYDMEKWGKRPTVECYRKEWLKKQYGDRFSDELICGIAQCFADFLKLSTYRKPEYVTSELYSIDNYNEVWRALDFCDSIIKRADDYYTYFRDTEWEDAFYQTFYYQAVGTANITRMQIYKSLSDYYARLGCTLANVYANFVDDCIAYDKSITYYYNNQMSKEKWHKMMSSPHVGFKTWNSEGWSYPEGSRVTPKDKAKMIVLADGGCNELCFSNSERQVKCITLGNLGVGRYEFIVKTDSDWIRITDKEGNAISGGSVETAGYLYVSIAWDKINSNKIGNITINSIDSEAKLFVNVKYTDLSDKDAGIHIEGCDGIAVDAHRFVSNRKSDNGACWQEIKGYGRYESVMRMYPTTVSFANRTGNTYTVTSGNNVRTVSEYSEPTDAPYLEYKIYVDKDTEYIFTVYTTPSNNIWKPQGLGYVPIELFYGIRVDNGAIKTVNSLPDGKYISFAADGDNRWIKGIKDNIHVSTSKEFMTKGIHCVRIYGMHPGLGLERIVISSSELKKSYLGPDKSYVTDFDATPEQKAIAHFEAGIDVAYMYKKGN